MTFEPDDLVQRRYRVLRRLGEGGASTAFLVHDLVWEREVCLKALRRSSAAASVLRNEFTRLSGLIHPNVCRAHDFGVHHAATGETLPYYTSEYVAGSPVDVYARDKTYDEIRITLAGVLSGVSFLHKLGIRHGDLTPANLLVGQDARAVVIDLSCSERLGASSAREISGTRGFIAPEILEGRPADARADLYGLGKTLERVVSVLRAPISQALRVCIERLTAPLPEQRPTSAKATLELLGLPWTFEDRLQAIPPKLIGRADARDAFGRFLSSVVEGRPGARVFSIVGPNGIGRTRLVSELKWQAQVQCSVIEGRASQPGAVLSMLERALGEDLLERDVSGALAARDRLVRDRTPRLFVLDDAHTLQDEERVALLALLRSITPTDPFAVLLTSRTSFDLTESQAQHTLRPLDGREIAEWAGGELSEGSAAKVLELTGGFPSEIVALLSAASPADPTSTRAFGRFDPIAWDEERRASLPALPEDARALLGTLAVAELAGDEQASTSFGDRVALVAQLVNAAWVRIEHGVLRLVRAGEAARILTALGEATAASLHAAAAERLRHVVPRDPAHEARTRALVVYYNSEAHDCATAERELVEHVSRASLAPQTWLIAADSLQRSTQDPAVLLSIAEVQHAAGQSREAIRTLARVLRARRFDLRPRVHRIAGEVYLGAGNPKRALRHLQRAYVLDQEGEARARIADYTSRTWMKLGNFRAALECARSAFHPELTDRARANLHHVTGLAWSYLGDNGAARRELRAALDLHATHGDNHSVVRARGALALAEYRSGATESAGESYRIALEHARAHGLTDFVVSMSASYAAVCHQLGDWGRAMGLYENALRLARAIGRKSTEATLTLNIAKLCTDIGDARTARDALARASSVAREVGLSFVEAAAKAIEGEICMVEGEPARALECFVEARRAFASEGATREVIETDANIVGAHLALGAFGAASNAFDDTEAAAQKLDAQDVLPRLLLARGRLELARNERTLALAHLEEGLRRSRSVQQRALEAEIEAELGGVAEAEGAEFLAAQHKARAREHWERIGLSLPSEQKDAFWAHPSRRSLKAGPSKKVPGVREEGNDRRLLRLLEINKRLNSSLDMRDVLEWTMDAAIELTSAERGFLILAEGDGADRTLDAPVARNMDREGIGKSNLKFSRSIAEQVIESGEAVVATDAEADARFEEARSIHAMQLKSICVVPIVSPKGTLGAIYLDHRFRVGGFQQSDVQLLLAFADQVAIALQNAHLVDSLKERTAELERERARVEQLLHGQARELERLSEALDAKQRVLELRYDYSNIVGRSAAMRSVLETLDRVIDKPVTVLIEGESGTGKELIARAIHFNSDRRERPFLAVNCGALPENLLEAELFGYVKGAFTGANRDRLGLFLEANGGTVFLDELGEMPPEMQVRLLRALQEREVQPLGSSARRSFDVRIVCATNRRLKKEVAEGRFREDLYYRVAVVDVALPPLRERREDIPLLAAAILERLSSASGGGPTRLTHDAMRALVTYDWPGNVRELENVLTRASVLADGGVLRQSDLTLPIAPLQRVAALPRDAERDSIRAALESTRWNVRAAAARLGMSRATLHRRLKHHDIRRASRS